MNITLRPWKVEDEQWLWTWIEQDKRIWTDFLGFSGEPDKSGYELALRALSMQILQKQAVMAVAEDKKGLVGVLAAYPITEDGALGHIAKNPARAEEQVGPALIKEGVKAAKQLGLPRVLAETWAPRLGKLMQVSGFKPPARTWVMEL